MVQNELIRENVYLEMVLNLLKHLIEDLEIEVKQNEKEGTLMARASMEELGAAPQPGNIEDCIDFLQQFSLENRANHVFEKRREHLKRLKQLRHKLYFGRVDFIEKGTSEKESIYVGYGHLVDEKCFDHMIYDWRSPIATLFYNPQIGLNHFKAPLGIVEGEVSLKRQFERSGDIIINYYDSGHHVVDEKLLHALSEKSDGSMGNIVETLQKEQYELVRFNQKKYLFIEGIAGSGKTVVALHQLAYAMYLNHEKPLKSEQALILSPNQLFTQYISNVLPDLGEESVALATPRGLYKKILGRLPCYESKVAYYDRICSGEKSPLDELELSYYNNSICYEALEHFVECHFLQEMAYRDLYYAETLLMDENEMRQLMSDGFKAIGISGRFKRLKERILERKREAENIFYQLEVERFKGLGAYDNEAVALARIERMKRHKVYERDLMAVLDENPEKVYEAFLRKTTKAIKHSPVLWAARERIEQNKLSEHDVVSICYLQTLISGSILKGYRQIVIDESQDYTTLFYRLLLLQCHEAAFTILGDSHQSIGMNRKEQFHNTLAASLKLNETSCAFYTLKIGYRNTKAIGDYLFELFGLDNSYKMISREGIPPTSYKEYEEAIDDAYAYGAETIAILTKNKKEAMTIYHCLKHIKGLKLIDDETYRIRGHVNILPIYLAKGMEFDAVIVSTKELKEPELLYIAGSRALHFLGLVD